MKRWNVAHSRDGYLLHLENVKWWVPTLEFLGSRVFCGHNFYGPTEFFWKIPLGKPKWDEDHEYLENSIPSKLLELEYEINNLTWNKGTTYQDVEISRETALTLSPDFVHDIEETMNED